MRRIASLFLASAAGISVGHAAWAADLPTRKAAPVEYVRICSAYGPGFFYIPGSDTCLRIGGRALFEYETGTTFNKLSDVSSFNATARLILDARTATDWGLLRAFARIDLSRVSGNDPLGTFGSGSGARAAIKFGFLGGGPFTGGFPAFAGIDTAGSRLQTGVNINAAFVQWGGLTAGRLQSFFDFYYDRDAWFGMSDSNILTQALAYTYTFGNGLSATLSIEDPKERQRYPIAGLAPVGTGGINPSTPNAAFNAVYPFAFSPYAAPGVSAINYIQRENVPDVVGMLNLTQGWGQVQLSGAYHRVESGGSTVNSLQLNNTGTALIVNPLVPMVSGGYGTVHGNGWAVQGGVKLNLPMIAAGDYVYLEAAYSKGALAYADSGFPAYFTGAGYSDGGGTSFSTYDAVVGPSGHLTLTPAYSALISYEHYWTPTIRQGLFAGAVNVRYSGAIRTAAGFAAGAACPSCLGTVIGLNGASFNPYSTQYDGGTQINIGSNLIWSPVKDLDLGVEVFYYRNQMQRRQFDVDAGTGKLAREDDAWRVRLRVLRDF